MQKAVTYTTLLPQGATYSINLPHHTSHYWNCGAAFLDPRYGSLARLTCRRGLRPSTQVLVPSFRFQVPKFGNGPHDNRNAVEHRSPGSRSAPWVTIPKQHLHPNGVHGRVFDWRHRRLVGEADRSRRLAPFGVAWST